MVVAYWIVAGVLCLFFLYAGAIKLVRSRTQLEPMMKWVDTVPMPVVRLIGTLEVLGAIGLILPPLTGVAPGLAIAAAVGLGIIQLLATGLHVRRGEGGQTWLNAILIVLCAVAAYLATAF